MEQRSKVLKKWQVVIPKEIRRLVRLQEGDVVTWSYRSGRIEVIPPRRIRSPAQALYGLVPSKKDAVAEIRRIRRKRLEKVGV